MNVALPLNSHVRDFSSERNAVSVAPQCLAFVSLNSEPQMKGIDVILECLDEIPKPEEEKDTWIHVERKISSMLVLKSV